MSIESRRAAATAKLEAWLSRGGRRDYNRTAAASPYGKPRPAAAPGVPPLPLRARQLFSKHTPWEEFERLRVDVGGRVLVPGGALITNGDRAWRCEVST